MKSHSKANKVGATEPSADDMRHHNREMRIERHLSSMENERDEELARLEARRRFLARHPEDGIPPAPPDLPTNPIRRGF